MNPNDLKELREHFRKEFQEHDFCIGEEQVERVFRELLGEPEPEREWPLNDHKGVIHTEIVQDTMKEIFGERLSAVFDNDNLFFKEMKER